MPWLAIAGMGVSAVSSIIGAQGQEDAAAAKATEIAQNETNSEWALQNQSNNLAVNEWLPVGIGQQRAQQYKLKTDQMLSTINAVAAMNGAGGSPDLVNLMSRIQAQGNQNAQTMVANGLMKTNAIKSQIAANDWSIKNGAASATAGINNSLAAGDVAAGGTLLAGATDLFTKYGSAFNNSGSSGYDYSGSGGGYYPGKNISGGGSSVYAGG